MQQVAAAEPDRVDQFAAHALADLLTRPGVCRVGLALTEGGGRRLRFTASDRDSSASVDWCHIDAYDDVPLTTVLRTGVMLAAPLERLDRRFSGFAAHQRSRGVMAVAAMPLPGSATPLGAIIFYFDDKQSFDGALIDELKQAAGALAQGLRSTQTVRRQVARQLADDADPAGALAADLSVDPDPRIVGEVRRWARTTLQTWTVSDDDIDTIVLCLSELATNAVIHARAPYVVQVRLKGTLFTATVRDSGGTPQASNGHVLPTDSLPVHGRGLGVVDMLATRWSAHPDAAGMTVQFALETSPSANG